MGIVVDAAEFSLWLSPHIISNTERVLDEGLGWAKDQAALFLDVLERVAAHSDGGVVDPPATVSGCYDWETTASSTWRLMSERCSLCPTTPI